MPRGVMGVGYGRLFSKERRIYGRTSNLRWGLVPILDFGKKFGLVTGL